jgi:general secretion pathway protein C
VRTSLHAQLLATVVANRPEWSIATIKDLNANETKICMVGDIFMGADVLAIEYLKVILLVDGHREYLDLSPPSSTVAIAPKGDNEAAPPPPSGEGIKKLDEHRYQIERSTVNNALSNMNDLAMQARIVPSFKNGQPNGFKLFSIRPDSLYAKIGIQNGDVIQRLNGFDMNSPDKALEAYTKLKSANAIDMQVERNGQTVNYHYGIQ